MMAPLSALCERSDFNLVHLNSRGHNCEIVQLQSALNDDYNNFQEKSNTYHISEPIIGSFSQTLCWYVHFGAVSLMHSAPQRNAATRGEPPPGCNTSQGFGAFFGQSCDRDRFLFPFISEFLSLFFSFLILRPSNTGNIFFQLVAQQCCVAS